MANNKRNLVVDDRVKSRKGRRRYKNETLPQQQLRKEKELLKQWKAVRDDAKKTKSIARKKAHDVSQREKESFNETDETEYEFCGEPEDLCIFRCCRSGGQYTKRNPFYV
jgi:hypothetical protein